MTGKFDVEEFLRKQDVGPGRRVKRSVMARFDDAWGAGRRITGRIAFWKRPVPLYIAVAGVLVSIGVAFLAGRGTMGQMQRRAVSREEAQMIDERGEREPEWVITKNDLL